MPRRIVGVELDARVIRAVEIRRGWRGCVLERFLELELPGDLPDDSDEWQKARETLHEWMDARRGNAITIASLPGIEGFSARLRLPFRRISKIQKVIKAEMENQVPLTVEETVVDFVPAPQDDHEGFEVLAVAVPKLTLARHLERLAGLEIVPDRLDFAPMAVLRTVSALMSSSGGGAFGIVHAGSTHLSVAISEGGRPSYIRSFRKRFELLAPPEGTPSEGSPLDEEVGFSDSPSKWDDSLMRDLRLSFLSRPHLEGDEEIEQLALAGGGAAAPHLAARLGGEIGIPCTVLGWESEAVLTTKNRPSLDVLGRIGVALGCALGAVKPFRVRFDLRREEFAHREGWRELRRPIAAAVAAAVLSAGVAVSDVSLKVRLEERRLKRLEAEIHSVFREVFPDAKRIVNPQRQIAVRVQEQGRRLATLTGSPRGGDTPLDVMAKISESVPPSLRMRLNQLDIDDQGVSMRGETPSFETVDRIKVALTRQAGFKGLELKQARLLQGGRGVEFLMRIPFEGPRRGGGR